MAYAAYEHYKQSGINTIGLMPQHWSVRRLKFMARIQNGKDYKEVVSDEGFPVIGSGGEFAKANTYLYNGESVLLGRKGTIDRPLYINGPFWTVDTMFYTEVATDVSAKYLYYCALTINFLKYATSTALPSMTQQDLGAIPFAAPDYDEQQAIARFLDFKTAQIDALIAKQKALLDKLAEKRTALISHAVTKGLNPSAPMKDSGVAWLGNVPAHWKCGVKLNYMAALKKHSFVNGPFGSDLLSSELTDDGVPVIYSGDVKPNRFFRKSSSYVTDEKAEQLNFCRVDPGDLLLAKVGDPPGDAAIYPEDAPSGVVTQDVVRIKLDETFVDPLYLMFLLNSRYGRFVVRTVSVEATRGRFSLGDFKSLRFVMPPFDEQQLIAESMNSKIIPILDQEAKVNEVISRLQEYRSALITNAVTGKIDVRNFPLPSLTCKEVSHD